MVTIFKKTTIRAGVKRGAANAASIGSPEARGPRENAVEPEQSEGVSLKRRNAAFFGEAK